MFSQLTFFVRPLPTPRYLISGTGSAMTEIPDELAMGNCNYRRPNMAMGNSKDTDDGHYKNVNMMFQYHKVHK